MNIPQIIIVDYGVGNLQSLKNSFEHWGLTPLISSDPSKILSATHIVLPGVGAFAAGMKGLQERGLTDTIVSFTKSGRPLLGICLGAQILFNEGHEQGVHRGLSILDGTVVPFPSLPKNDKIPHMGWNSIYPADTSPWTGTILDSIPVNAQTYFVHSFIIEPTDSALLLAKTCYGGHEFASVIKKGSIYGIQFHPEKSGPIGLQIIKNFISLS